MSKSKTPLSGSEYNHMHSLNYRIKECVRLRRSHPDKIPVLFTAYKNNILKIHKFKYLISINTTMGQVLHIIRNNISIKPAQALFAFINNTLISPTDMIESVHKKLVSSDGFLYITLSLEETFG